MVLFQGVPVHDVQSEGAVVDAGQRERSAVCLDCLRHADEWVAGVEAAPRRRAALIQQLHHLLQYVTITTSHSLRTVPAEAISAWLEPARGLALHDLRVDLLGMLADRLDAPNLRAERQGGSAPGRRRRELLGWGWYQRELTRRTRAYFDAITQDEIIAAELACVPFYEALHAASPARDFSGVFVDSDEVIVDRVTRLNPTAASSIVDIGCGRGRLLGRLRQEFPDAQLTGTSIFEFSHEELDALDARRVTPVYCTAQRLEMPDASQDIVVCSEVIEHLRHPEDLIGEIHRVLTPGGVFCVTAPSRAGYLYGPNPFSYLMIAAGTVVPSVLPRFHDLYAPLTAIPIVHYGFDPHDLRRRFAQWFPSVAIDTTRFTALEKFRLATVAPWVPILKMMGGLCVAYGTKPS